jgi:hypothetical protein
MTSSSSSVLRYPAFVSVPRVYVQCVTHHILFRIYLSGSPAGTTLHRACWTAQLRTRLGELRGVDGRRDQTEVSCVVGEEVRWVGILWVLHRDVWCNEQRCCC